MEQIKNIVTFTIANIILFFGSARFFGDYLAFGNTATNEITAIVLTSLIVALVSASIEPVTQYYKIKFPGSQWMLVYFVVNSATIYVLARTPLSYITAIGISAFWVALILGFIINLVHSAILKLTTPKR